MLHHFSVRGHRKKYNEWIRWLEYIAYNSASFQCRFYASYLLEKSLASTPFKIDNIPEVKYFKRLRLPSKWHFQSLFVYKWSSVHLSLDLGVLKEEHLVALCVFHKLTKMDMHIPRDIQSLILIYL
jgi:hypothetical protein